MHNLDHRAASAGKHLPGLILAALVSSVFVFSSGCQADRPAVMAGAPVRYAQLANEDQKTPAARPHHEDTVSDRGYSFAQPMVQLTSFELAQTKGDYPSSGRAVAATGFT